MHALAAWAGARVDPRCRSRPSIMASARLARRGGGRAGRRQPRSLCPMPSSPGRIGRADPSRRTRRGGRAAGSSSRKPAGPGPTASSPPIRWTTRPETVLMRLAAGSGLTGLAGMTALASTAASFTCGRSCIFRRLASSRPAEPGGGPSRRTLRTRTPRFARTRWRRPRPGARPRRARPGAPGAPGGPHGGGRTPRWTRPRLRLRHGACSRTARARAAALAAEPLEIGLRVLRRALATEPCADPIRLERLEACFEALIAAHREGAPPGARSPAACSAWIVPAASRFGRRGRVPAERLARARGNRNGGRVVAFSWQGRRPALSYRRGTAPFSASRSPSGPQMNPNFRNFALWVIIFLWSWRW
jgi:hypothetical protein